MELERLVALLGVHALAISRVGVEPYLVQCSSCQSKIRVRNPSLVGKKVNCPKCAAEILIRPPASPKIHVAASDQSSVDSTAMTKEGFADSALAGLQNLTSLESPHRAEPPGAFSNFDFSEVDQVLIQQAQQASAEQTMQHYADPDLQASSPTQSWQAPERAAPSDQWSSKSAAKSRQMLIVAFLGVSSCLVAALAFYLFLRWYNSGPTVADKPANQNQLQVDPNGQSADVGSNTLDSKGSEGSSQNPPFAPTESTSLAEDKVDPPQIVIDTNTNTAPNDSAAKGADNTKPNENSSSSTTNTLPDASPKKNLDTDAEPKIVNPEAPPRILEMLKVIGDPQTIEEPPKLIIPDQPKVTDLEIQSGARDLKMTPVAKLTELASQRKIWSLRISQRKLHDVVSLWNSTVGLPVAVSNLSLAAADYDMSQRFDIDLKDVNATTGIEQLASALGLRVEVRENRFWLLYAANPNEDKLPSKVRVDDLVSDSTQQQWLMETIELIFPGTSGSITLESGFLSAKSDQLDRLTWFVIVRMLDNWRSQLGLPIQLSSYRKENIEVPFVTAAKMRQLDTTLSQVNSTAKPLSQLINQQCNAANLTSLVDWPALEYLPVRLSGGEMKSILPQTPRISVTFDRPLKNFLKEMEFELGITALLYDEKTLLLTSKFAYRRMPQVFVMPSEGKSVEGYWSQYFRPLTPIDSFGISNVVIRVTPDGKYLIVKSCWPTLQFE